MAYIRDLFPFPLDVSVLPEEDPIITGQDEVYIPGSYISLNCTSERSKPAAQLMWFINEQRVRPGVIQQLPEGEIGCDTAANRGLDRV